MKSRTLLLMTTGFALLAGSAAHARPDPYQCRAQVRTELGIVPHEGHLVPGFWVKVHECIYKAKHPDHKNVASGKPHAARKKKAEAHVPAVSKQTLVKAASREKLPAVSAVSETDTKKPSPLSQSTTPVTADGSGGPANSVSQHPASTPSLAGASPILRNPDESAKRVGSQINQFKQITSDLESQTKLLTSLIAELKADRSRNESPSDLVNLTLILVQQKLTALEKQQAGTKQQHPQVSYPLRPDDQTSYPTARAVSETYPLVRYYISGTNEEGNIWVLPAVSDAGQLQFRIRFLDPGSPTDETRSEAILNLAQVDQMAAGLAKLYRWSQIAHHERIRREYEKRVECFPAVDCPDGDKRVDGKSSTELLFHVSDEGATNGVFRRNKGQYVENFSLSMESVVMLWCYMHHVINEGELDYKAGSQTKENLDQLFK